MLKRTFILLAFLLAACSAESEPSATPLIAQAPTASPVPASTTSSDGPDAVTQTPHPEPATPTPRSIEARPSPTDASASNSDEPNTHNVTLQLEPVVEGFAKPTYLTHAFDERLFVTEQHGVIHVVSDGERLETPFLDIQDLVESNGSEQGLLSVAFHPEYTENGWFFVNYTDEDGDTVVARYEVSDDPNVAEPESATMLMTIAQPFGNHNGGQLQFGPDGYLYIGMGDGGGAGDPEDNGQDPETLLGTLLRIDVNESGNGANYAIPPDNPFSDNPEWRLEIWSIGLRNPWRFSFDRETGNLFIADVGQNQFEEINVSPPGESRAANYGWPIMEASHCFEDEDCKTTGLVLPEAEYAHNPHCSVTGGYVYRGSAYPALAGHYFYGDYCSGTIWSMASDNGSWQTNVALESELTISSFGQDAEGELYVLDHVSGTVYRLQPEEGS